MIKANYHTHTFRCHHGYGCEWEYVEKAIKGGIKIFGFADHAPYHFPNGYYSRMRMSPEDLPDYIATVERMKKLYGDRIEILCGLEAEYYPELFPRFLEMLRENPGVEYLILGQHYYHNEYETGLHTSKPQAEEHLLANYVDQVLEGLATGRFLYLCHPGVCHYTGDETIYRHHMRRLCREVRAMKIPMELNLQGHRAKNHYPSEKFWEIAAEENCTAILGLDAHRATHVCDPEEIAAMTAFAQKMGVRLIDEVPLKEDFLK
ncbi:MAG: histidinol-phosphatase [Clostridia bacterium]|nr:histidinol-phosphatase [Clostridia bacterium]